MLEDMEYDDADSPAIGLVPAGVSWETCGPHKDRAHPLLVVLGDGAGYAGVYWTGTEAVTVADLGSDHEQAVEDFREYLRARGDLGAVRRGQLGQRVPGRGDETLVAELFPDGQRLAETVAGPAIWPCSA